MRVVVCLLLLNAAGCASQVELSNLNVGATVVIPSAANFPANGLTRATVMVQLARNDGTPLQGLSVTLSSAHCTVVQPSAPSDAAGRVQGEVMCVRPALETVTASILFNGAAATLTQTAVVNFFTPADGHLGVAAGTPLAAQVVAMVADGNSTRIDSTYTGAVTFSSTDPLATLPPDYTVVAADHGFHTWSSALIWRTVGQQIVTATDRATGKVIYTETYTVVPSPAQGIRLVATEEAQAGRNVGLTVAVVDALGNVIPTYTGTVQLFSSDPVATLPPSVVFTPADTGSKFLAAGLVLRTAGQQSVSAQDNASPPLTGSVALVVASGAVKQLVFAGLPLQVASGSVIPAMVRAADAFGNAVPSYVGSAQLSTSDTRMGLPATANFSAESRGQVVLSGLTFVAAGITSLSATPVNDANLASAQTAVVVTPGEVQSLLVLPQRTTVAGQAASVLVQALDLNGNPVNGYRGTVSFASDDPAAVLPGSYTFNASDAGGHAFAQGVTFLRAGVRTLAAQDATLPAAQGNCMVTPAAMSRLTVTAPTTSTAGQAVDLVVSGTDVYGNTVPNYSGTVALSSGDGLATLPASVTLGSGDQGSVSVPAVVLRTSGPQTVVAADTSSWQLQNGTVTVAVTAAALTQLTLNNVPSTVSIATVITPVVAGADMFGNPAGSYRGRVTLTSSDPCATLPAPYTFGAVDAGSRSFTGQLVLNTLGTQSVTATDDQGHTVTKANISVVHGCGPWGAGLSWNPVSGNGFVNNIRMALDPNNNPWLVIADNRGSNLPGGWWDNWRIFAAHWDGQQFDNTFNLPGLAPNPISNSDHCAENPSLALDANGQPYIAWHDFCDGGIYLARLRNGAWEGVNGSQAAPLAGGSWDVELHVSKQGTPWLAWLDGATNQLHLRYFDGTQWQGPGGSFLVPGTAQYTSKDVAVDSQGRVYVAFTSNHNGSTTLQAYVAMWDGSNWQGLAGSNSAVGVSNTVGGASNVHLAIDSQDRPVVSWSDSRSGIPQVYLVRYQGGSWQGQGGSSTGLGASNQSGQPVLNAALTLDRNDRPVTAWFVYNQGNNTQYQVGRFDGSVWAVVSNNVSLVSSGGLMISTVAVDARDKPIFAFWGWASSVLCSLY